VHIEGRDLWLWVKFDNAATYKALKAQYAQTFEAFDNKVFEYSKGRSQWYFARIRAAFKPRPQFYRNKNKGVTVQATEKTQIGVNVAPKLA
jgi:hypothetical protein